MKEIKPADSMENLYDYSQSKDAYDGNLNSEKSVEPLPESSRPRKDGPGGEGR